MLSTLKNAFKVPELKNRILFTLFLVAIFRFGNHIPVPGIDTTSLQSSTESSSLLGFYDLMSGGALRRFSIFANGVVPYINASIIMQLLAVAVPYLEQLQKEGEEGRKKIQKYTRNAAVIIALIQSYGSYVLLHNTGGLKEDNTITALLIVVTVTTGSIFLMWLGDQITTKGLGNGISLIIFINIVSSLPQTFKQVMELQGAGEINPVQTITFVAVVVVMLLAVIIMTLAERRITVQYAGKTINNKSFRGQSSHIPFSLTATGVIAIIFAMSVMQFPITIAKFWPTAPISTFMLNSSYSIFKESGILYPIAYAVLVIFFSWFYAQVTFKPEEMAENIYKSQGFIPGIRPGQNTALYISKVLTFIAIIGGTFAAIIAVVPIVVQNHSSFQGIYFGGTTILILVNVAMDNVRTLESQLIMRHYGGFLK